MGYRSDILSAVTFADAAHNTESMVKWKLHCSTKNALDVLEQDEDFKANTTYPVLAGKYPTILLQAQGWKWHPSYDDVQGWHEFIDYMRDECDAAVTFIRIGEENHDIEDLYHESSHAGLRDFYPWDFFGVRRSIICDVE